MVSIDLKRVSKNIFLATILWVITLISAILCVNNLINQKLALGIVLLVVGLMSVVYAKITKGSDWKSATFIGIFIWIIATFSFIAGMLGSFYLTLDEILAEFGQENLIACSIVVAAMIILPILAAKRVNGVCGCCYASCHCGSKEEQK